jgi:hypothetical protein
MPRRARRQRRTARAERLPARDPDALRSPGLLMRARARGGRMVVIRLASQHDEDRESRLHTPYEFP